MWSYNKSVKIGLMALALVLLVVSSLGVWKAFSMPLETEEQAALVSYQHIGEFDYSVYVEPTHLFGSPQTETANEQEETESLYFRNIIEDISVQYDYKLTPSTPLTEISTNVNIVAIITGPSKWKKEFHLTNALEQNESVTISFPLSLEEFNEEINIIEEELGIRTTSIEENSYDVVIEARVQIMAHNGSEWIEDSFTQPMQVGVSKGTLYWDNALSLSKSNFHGEFRYEHWGGFSYTIRLKENSLYDTNVITSPLLDTPSPIILIPQPAGDVYFTKISKVMETDFSYQFKSSHKPTSLYQELEITAILEYPGTWSKTFILVPKVQISEASTVDFPLDIIYFSEMVNTIRDEIGMGAAEHNLTIKAEVYTTAVTEFGIIDAVFSHTLNGKLGMTTITWSDELIKTEYGSIDKTILVPNPDKFLGLNVVQARIIFPILTVIFLPLCLWLLIITIKSSPTILSKEEIIELRVRNKHKDVFLEVNELPKAEPRQVVIQISSLDELVRASDALLKPVLYRAEAERHTYCVIDGAVRYQYLLTVNENEQGSNG